MTVDEIKQARSMHDIVASYGFHPNRAGFISCPFHTGDHTASMKIYKDSYNCFGCGANGDVFSFVQGMEHCDFKTAFYSLGGTYEKPTKASEIALYHVQKAKEKRKREEECLRRKIDLNNQLIGIYVTWLKKLEPLSDVWCDCQNALMVCLYHDEVLEQELERGGRG